MARLRCTRVGRSHPSKGTSMTSRTHTPEDVQKIMEPWRDSASDYERGFIDGMQRQRQSSVDKAVNAIKAALANEALERKAENARELGLDYEPWEKFCDSNCVWTDHHPDCKLAQIEHGWTPERIAGMARLKAQQNKRLEPQRTWVGLTDEERESIVKEYQSRLATALIIEAKLKEKNT